MSILEKSKEAWVDKHRPDSCSRGSPPGNAKPNLRQKRKSRLPLTVLTLAISLLAMCQMAYAAQSKTQTDTVKSSGTYTVVAIDEAGNRTVKVITLDNIVPFDGTDEEGNITPDNVPDSDEDYSEDIVATLVNDAIVSTNGNYTVFVTDEAGNTATQKVTVRNIVASENEPGKDETGDIVPDTSEADTDYSEDIVDHMNSSTSATTNGQFTAFVTDEAGNLTKRTITVTNVKAPAAEPAPGEVPEIAPEEDIPSTDEDYTEDIVDTMTKPTTVTSNGQYSAAVYDEAGNLAIVDIDVQNINETGTTPGDQTPDTEEITPDPGVPNTDDDYTEEITSQQSANLKVTESGIYAAIVKDNTGNYGIADGTVNIIEEEPSDNPVIVPIKPDEPGTEEPSPDGNTIVSTQDVYENGFYAAAGIDCVDNIGLDTVLVRNIGAPDVKVTANPKTLVRKTADDGATYGEATITFTVTVPDGALLDYVKLVDADGNEMPLDLTNGVYTATVTKNGEYEVQSADVTGRDGVYPIDVDYIYELEPETTVQAYENDPVTLDANVVGGTPDSFQWYTCDETGSNAMPISGATQSTYTFNATPAMDGAHYFCVATKGTYAVTSPIINMEVFFAPILQAKGYVIAAEGFDTTMTVGRNVNDTIYITKDGNPNDYEYQWYYSVGSKGQKIPIDGATGSSYTTNVTADMNGRFYFCEITTSKCETMSSGTYLYACGKPTAPTLTATLTDGTVIPSDQWSTSAPLTVSIGGSTASGTTGLIEYQYSYDKIHWLNYEEPISFDTSVEGTTIYAKAVNAALTTVDSDISEHIVRIELEDPSIHDDPGADVVPGVRYDKDTWVNAPTKVDLYVNTMSGVKNLSVFYKGEGESSFHELLKEDGSSQYIQDAELADTAHFTNTRVEEGLWRVTLALPENGWYRLAFQDASGRPLNTSFGTQDFEITHIDYGIPTVASATLDKEGNANNKTITVTDAHDEYSASTYGYSELYAYGYSTETDVAPAKDDESWIALSSENSSYTVDTNGTKHYNFDIDLAGEADNGTYHIWVMDKAGNVSEAQVVEVTGLYDKMTDVNFDKTNLDLTCPTPGTVKATFVGQPESIEVSSANENVATVSYRLTDTGVYTISVTPVDYGTTTVTITLRDYDGTEYNHDVSVSVENMIPSVKGEPQDTAVKPDAEATFTASIAGTNLTYQWYYSNTSGGTGVPITQADNNYTISVNDDSESLHTATLTINTASPDMTNTYYWCVATATEGTAAYTTQTRIATLLVWGNVTKPTISANSGNVTTGQWTNQELNFSFTDSKVESGSGTVGYQYHYDNDTAWSNCANTLTYTGDTHEKVLHVRAYNTLNAEIVSDEATFIIRVDTVAPEITISGNPTDWVSVDTTMTATVTDADSGVTDDTVNMTVKNSDDVAVTDITATGSGTYAIIIKKSDTYTVAVHDVAGNETVYELLVNRIDREAPVLVVTQGTPDGSICPVTLYATDDASTQAELLYTFDGGTTWTQASMQILTVGQTYSLGVKDAAGNIALRNVNITGNSSSGSGTSSSGTYVKPIIITNDSLDCEDYIISKTSYLDANGTAHTMGTYSINGTIQAAIDVKVTAAPYTSGEYLSGYAKLSTGQKFPIYWDADNTVTSTSEGGTGHFYINPSVLTTSAKDATITVIISEYTSAEMVKKSYSDSISAPLQIDVNAPVVNISLDRTTNIISITARDAIAGLASTKYAIITAAGQSDWYDYDPSNPLVLTGSCKIAVEAIDKVGNGAGQYTTSNEMSLDGTGGATGDGVASIYYPDSYYYRTAMFNYYLIGTGNTNT